MNHLRLLPRPEIRYCDLCDIDFYTYEPLRTCCETCIGTHKTKTPVKRKRKDLHKNAKSTNN